MAAADALNDPWIKMFTNQKKIKKPISASALTQLKGFYSERKLENAVLAHLNNTISTKDDKVRLLASL